PVSSAIASGWSGMSIAVMASSCADAAGASAQSTASKAASDTRRRVLATAVERVIVVIVVLPGYRALAAHGGEHRPGKPRWAAAIRNWTGPIIEPEYGPACRLRSCPGGDGRCLSKAFGHAARQRVVQPRHEARATTAKCAVHRARRQPAQLAGHACAHAGRIGRAGDRGAPRQLDPGDGLAVGEMPDAALTVDQQVQAC